MAGIARADSSGVALVVSMEGGWSLTLRRADFKPDEALSRYFGKNVRAQDLRTFLPNWPRLTWRRLPENPFYKAEVSARDGVYLVNLQAAGGGNEGAVLEAFCGFMKG